MGASFSVPNSPRRQSRAKAVDGRCKRQANLATLSGGIRLTLTDMPESWLQQFAPAVASTERLALAQTCQAMMQLMLSHHRVVLKVGKASSCKSVNLVAFNQSAHVKLVLQVPQLDPEELLFKVAMSLKRPQLTSIRHLTVQGYSVHDILTPWLQETCPNLTSLSIESTDLTQPSLHFPQLKHLHIDLVHSPSTKAVDVHAVLSTQLQILPNLESLIIRGYDESIHVVKRWMYCCTSSASQQLMHIEMPDGLDSIRGPALMQLHTCFPHLHTLILPGYFMVDAADSIEAILNISTLRHLQCCAMNLTANRQDRPCPWTHLTLQQISVPSIACLDLQHLNTLRAVHKPLGGSLHAQTVSIIVGPAAEEFDRLAAVVQACGGIDWEDGVHQLCIASSGPEHCARMADMMLVLANCPATSLHIAGNAWTRVEMVSMAGHIPQAVRMLQLEACMFTPGSARLLLCTLTESVEVVRFELGHERLPGGVLREADVVDMCAGAKRGVMVVVHEGTHHFAPGWMRRVQRAMQAHGHQHVELREK